MEPYIDFFELATEREKLELDLEEKKTKMEKNEAVADDQHHQEVTAMAPESKSAPIDHLQCFPKENRRPRTKRKILGTMKMTKDGLSYDMKEGCDKIVDGQPLPEKEVLRREKLLKSPMEVEPESTSEDDDDDERVLNNFDFFKNCAQGNLRNGILIRDGMNSQREEMLPKNLLKTKMKDNGRLHKEIKKTKVRKVLGRDVHRQPRAKIVETQKLFLDLNHPPLEEIHEKKLEKKSKIKKRKNDSDNYTIKKKKRTSAALDDGPDPPPELPQDVIDRIRQRAESKGREHIDDGELILVVQKRLTPSDLDQQQNRLIFTKNQMRNEFLTKEEIKTIEDKDEKKHHKFLKVRIIEPSKQVKGVNFTRWMRGKSSESFLLNQDWRKVVKYNHLQQGQVVQLWAFRINGKLNFALVILPPKPEEDQKDKSSAAAENGEERGTEIASTSKAAASITPDDSPDEQMASNPFAATSQTTSEDENKDASDCGDECMEQAAKAVAPNYPPENDEVERNTRRTVSHDNDSNDEDKASASDMFPNMASGTK